jgi:hypothetical protein
MHIPIPARLARACTVGLILACSVTSALQAGPPIKNPVAVEPEAHPMYLGTVTGGVKTSDVYTEGNFSIVAPVWSTLGAEATLSGDVIYLEPYTSWGEGGEVAASLGLGWRHLFGSQPISALRNYDAPQPGFFDEGVFVGANVFVDMLDTESDNQFWQLGVGLEVGTRYVELRGNYYIPLSDKQLAEETRTVDTIQRSSTSSSQSVTPTSDPYATGSNIAQDALFTTTTTTSISTTTIERLFRRFEEGMEGWDAEIAVLIPGLDRYFDLRVIGGYYAFDNQPFGPQVGGTGNVEGWKAGVEIRPVPAVILTGTWYEDERLTGSDWIAGVQLQIPFEGGDLGDGKTFWSRIGESFTPRRRHLVERLAEPVRRQNAAIKVANTVDTETNTSTKVKKVTKVTQRPGQVVLEDDIVFVNNDGPVGNGIQAGAAQADGATGTAEQPFNTISEGANTAGANSNATGRLWTVYTQGGTGIDYEDYVEVSGSTRFISSYVPVVGLGGRTFGGDTIRPVYYGGFDALDINTLIVQGYDIRGGLDGYGPAIAAFNPATLIVKDNLFTETGYPAIYAIFDSFSTHNVTVQNNEFRNLMAALYIGTDEFSGPGPGFGGPGLLETLDCGCGPDSAPIINLLVTDNLVRNAYAGFIVEVGGGAVVTGNISDNRIGGNYIIGSAIEAYGDASVDVTISGNRFGGEAGAALVMSSYEGANLVARVLDNRFPGEFETVLGAAKYDAATLDVTFAGNLLNGEYHGRAVDFYADAYDIDESYLNAVVQDNRFTGYFDEDAVHITREGAAQVYASIVDNNFSGYFGERTISVKAFGDSGVTTFAPPEDPAPESFVNVTISGNRFRGYHGEEAIFLKASEGSRIDAVVTGNIFRGEFDNDAVGLRTTDYGRLNVTAFADNVMRQASYADGVFLNAVSKDYSEIIIDGFDRNLILGSLDVGFVFDERNHSKMKVNGTLDPAASNEVTNAQFGDFISPNGNVGGKFFLNGSQVNP